MKSLLWRVSVLVLVVVTASCSGKSGSAPENMAGTPPSGQANQSGTMAIADDAGAPQSGEKNQTSVEARNSSPESLAKLLQEIEDEQAKLPRDWIDPAAVVDAARDPSKILAWMRDNTRLAAYEGSLRGPLGVLMDRRGNSLDRALLLARLLGLAGFETRVMSGKLSPSNALKVLADNSEAVAKPFMAPADDGKLARELNEQAASIAAMIAAKTGPLPAAAQVAESRHYWVQYKDGSAWVDADPTLGGVGQARPHADGMPLKIDPKTYGLALPAGGVGSASDLMHSVEMRLVVERWDAGKLVESTLLSVPFDPSAGPLAPATVTFVPVDPATGKAVRRAFTTGAGLRAKLLSETAWAPLVRDDKSGWRMGRRFDDAGIVGDLPKAFDGAAELGGAATSRFGNFTDAFGGGEESAEAPTVLTALIADYEIKGPGKPARLVRRFIFDSIGPNARRNAQSMPRPYWTEQQLVDRGAGLAALNDTLVAFASPSSDAYVYSFAQRVIDSKDAIFKFVTGSVDAATLERAAYGLSFRTLELFAATRDSAMNPMLAIVEPQIIRRVIRYVPDTNATAFDVQVFGDLAWNRLASAGGAANATALVTQGVLDTLQESAIVLGSAPALPVQPTVALFEEAARQKIEIVAVRDAKDVRLANFPGQARAWMLRDLEAGQVLVTPVKPVMIDGQPRLGWWRVDPTTGQVVGAMDTGLLPALVQYAAQITTASGLVVTFFGRAGPAAQSWANYVMRLPGSPMTTVQQWHNLLHLAQSAINSTGSLPPIP